MRIMKSCFFAATLFLLAACTGRPDGIEPVTGFDVTRYDGKWYEIMRLDHSFERGLTNVSATYTIREDGKLGVLNRGFDPEDCEWDEADGTAVFQGSPDVASLSVTFFWPFAGGYHAFELDKQDYNYVLISGPNREFLWMLARQPDLSTETRNRLIARAAEEGFPVEELILVDHSKQDCIPGN